MKTSNNASNNTTTKSNSRSIAKVTTKQLIAIATDSKATDSKRIAACQTLAKSGDVSANDRKGLHAIYSALQTANIIKTFATEAKNSGNSLALVRTLLPSKSGREILFNGFNESFEVIRHALAISRGAFNFPKYIEQLRASDTSKTTINGLLSIKIGGKVFKTSQKANVLHENFKRHLATVSKELGDDTGYTLYTLETRKAADHDDEILSVYASMSEEFKAVKESGKAFDGKHILKQINELTDDNLQVLINLIKAEGVASNATHLVECVYASNHKSDAMTAQTSAKDHEKAVDKALKNVAKKSAKQQMKEVDAPMQIVSNA